MPKKENYRSAIKRILRNLKEEREHVRKNAPTLAELRQLKAEREKFIEQNQLKLEFEKNQLPLSFVQKKLTE